MLNESQSIQMESWFIPIDILSISVIVVIICLSIIYLLIIIFDKTTHTVAMMLVANSCLIQLILGITMLGNSIFRFENDLKQIQHEDRFCAFRGYLTYALSAVQNYSYLLQSFYRYKIVRHPTRIFWQRRKIQLSFIIVSWLFALIFPLPPLVTGQIQYIVDDQICQVPLTLSFTMPFHAFCIYLMPISMIIFVYSKIVRYVHGINGRTIVINTIIRAKRELRMIRRISLLIIILATIEFPYALFVFMGFFTKPPRYHFRIAWIFMDISSLVVTIVLFLFTEPFQISIKKLLKFRRNLIPPALS